jgi:glucose-6-phosphate isomerase
MALPLEQLAHFNPQTGTITGNLVTERRLSDMPGLFADTAAYDSALANDDPVLYSLTSVEPAQGEGQLHYGLGLIRPGRIGAEYYMTKGHFHAWRAAAEVYIGLSGSGLMMLEHETSGACQVLPFSANRVIYVPGFTAHRTINTGTVPLSYLGVYPAQAGHDYGAIGHRNFKKVVVALNETPTPIDRDAFLAMIHKDGIR